LPEQQQLRIVHCFRSPVGGIFRHVRDLIEVQVAEGHHVGILCDSNTGGEFEEALFDAIKPNLALGLHRIPMNRRIGPSDIVTLWRSYNEIKQLNPEILHSHGAKGGAYARMIGTLLRMAGSRVARLYCPHGGSIHFDAATLRGRVYFVLERFLERSTDRLIFVSNYEKRGYFEKVGRPGCPYNIVFNGLKDEEFEPVASNDDAVDFLFIGMMRDLKGPDVFIAAIPIVEELLGRKISALMVGDGPDIERYRQTVTRMELDDRVVFLDPMPARAAFAKANIVVVPSRAESLPYIVLETIAAAKPLITTNVGGIPEIFGGNASALVKPGSAIALAGAMAERLKNPNSQENANLLAESIRGRFSTSAMAAAVANAYRESLQS